jgi:restriction endonuclease S subunit
MFSDIRAQWELIENNTDYQFYSVFFINDSTGFITGYINPYNVIRKTTDYGNTWTTVYQEEANYFLMYIFHLILLDTLAHTEICLKQPIAETLGFT